MRRAIELASHGRFDAHPNPMVGAVIVDSAGHIIGEGWHRKCGEGHAEVNAVASVKNQESLRHSTMYVTLEPCSHYGKTPPCAKLLIDKGIPRVVVGSLDPFDKVCGRGISMLREAGVEVKTGVLEQECRRLNRKFFVAHTRHRPYITLKWAESSDGFIDGQISTPLTSVLVHKLRAENDAILVGSNTYITDKPRLDTRLFAGRSPLKFVVDRRGRIRDEEGLTVIRENEPLEDIMAGLYNSGVTSLLVEGGAELHGSFLSAGLWDELRVEQGRKDIVGKVKAPLIPSVAQIVRRYMIDGNYITSYYNTEES